MTAALTEESISGQGLKKFKEEVESKSEGRITVDIYYNGVLGNTNAVMDMAAEGDVQMMTMNPVAMETQVTELATASRHFTGRCAISAAPCRFSPIPTVY